VGTLADLSGAGGPLLLVLYLLLSGGALLALVRDWRRRAVGRLDMWRRLLIVAWLVIPLLSTFLVSFVKPVFVSRFLIVALPPFVLLAAAGLALVRPRWLFGLTLVDVAALSVRAVFLWYEDYRKENWRAAVSYVLSNAQSGDGLVFIPSRMRTPFQVYVEMLEADVSTPTPVYPPGG
jgi:4-amino-4-deoxy-L-arabinose transferase-like glycosyltransferase